MSCDKLVMLNGALFDRKIRKACYGMIDESTSAYMQGSLRNAFNRIQVHSLLNVQMSARLSIEFVAICYVAQPALHTGPVYSS